MTVKDLIGLLSERQAALFHTMSLVMDDHDTWQRLHARLEEVNAMLRLLRGGGDA